MMYEQEIRAEKSIEVSDLVEQISRLNHQINLHRQTTQDKAMIYQYSSMKANFLQKLKTLLLELEFDVAELVA
jgi:hypothetical protein